MATDACSDFFGHDGVCERTDKTTKTFPEKLNHDEIIVERNSKGSCTVQTRIIHSACLLFPTSTLSLWGVSLF